MTSGEILLLVEGIRDLNVNILLLNKKITFKKIHQICMYNQLKEAEINW